jgi:hypothetical protein
MKIINLEQEFLYTTGYYTAVKTVEFIRDKMSYIVVRGRWCNIIVLFVQVEV